MSLKYRAFLYQTRTTSFQLARLTIRTMSENRKTVAVCQMTSNNDKQNNFKTCKSLVENAKDLRAKMVFLPEACDFIAEKKEEIFELAEPLDGSLMQQYRTLAKDNDIWLSLGGLHEKTESNKIFNAHVVIDNSGNIVSVYRKAHLFDVEIPDKGIRLKESDYVLEGKDIIHPIDTPVGRVGLSICYDMRFAELNLTLSKLGAQILTFPSAFTFVTGSAHWEVLLRARAIESQCYVIAAAQTGAHNKKRSSWGHAVIVDPWGDIVAQCSSGTRVAIAEIDISHLEQVRASLPVWQHRRTDLYPELLPLNKQTCYNLEEENKDYVFGQTCVPSSCIFYRTELSFAFTNKRCAVPGHVLVAPIRSALRFPDLSQEEVQDLFMTVQKVQVVIEDIHKTSSTTIVIQDGEDAGQTIKHVHVHILPRRNGDFPENDQIYRELQKNDSPQSEKPWRTCCDMSEEAAMIRKYFKSH